MHTVKNEKDKLLDILTRKFACELSIEILNKIFSDYDIIDSILNIHKRQK